MANRPFVGAIIKIITTILERNEIEMQKKGLKSKQQQQVIQENNQQKQKNQIAISACATLSQDVRRLRK